MEEKTLTKILDEAQEIDDSLDVYLDATALYSGPVGGNGGNDPILSPWQIQSETINSQYREEPRLDVEISPRSFKIREDGHPPLIRIDRLAHHGLPENHLQYGDNTYTGRHDDEAYDIFGEIFKNAGDKFKMPWED
ncbi:hypothetical protein D6777_00975 [Candidatus Woesearchaeota archaeon]|nr:MAG: hypothetical protein D6777_00975 [Candidatus Woesearchaeota archaeon]